MKVWGLTVERIESVVQRVSAMYEENIVFKREPEKDGRAVSFTLTVGDTRAPGSRRSNTGRRISACCWHGHRDVMMALMLDNPRARIRTAFADYRGFVDFSNRFGATGKTNIGSIVEPMLFRDACNCS